MFSHHTVTNTNRKKNWQDLLNRHNLLVSYQLTFQHRSDSTQRSPQGSSSTGSANLVPVNCAAAPFLTRCWLSSCVEIRDCYSERLLCQDLFGSHKVSLRSGTGKETEIRASVSIFNSLLNVVIPWRVEVGFKSLFFYWLLQGNCCNVTLYLPFLFWCTC